MSYGESECSWRILQTRRTPILSAAETSHTDPGISFHPFQSRYNNGSVIMEFGFEDPSFPREIVPC
jgi:hypothetical protein